MSAPNQHAARPAAAHDRGVTHELHGRVRDALVRAPYFAARSVDVRVDRGDVVLTGAVRSWYHKQMAQEAVRRVAGVEGVRNELCVAG